MTIKQCDKCATIVEGPMVMIGRLYSGVELCKQCAEPVLQFLAQHDLLQKARLEELYASTEMTGKTS